MNKKLLFLSYYWPPYGGGGVQRALKLAKYLSRMGWKINVITSKKSYLESIDRTLLKEVPRAVKVIKTANLSPNTSSFLKKVWVLKGKEVAGSSAHHKSRPGIARKIVSFLRVIQLPDESFGWMPFLYAAAKGVVLKEKPDVILATSPPYSILLVAVLLKKFFQKPLVIDVRDAWANLPENQHPYIVPGWRKGLDARLEKSIMRQADFITVVSPPMKKYLQSIGIDGRNIKVLANGFDQEDFRGLKKIKEKKQTIIYTGVFYGKKVPIVFLDGLKKFLKKHPEMKNRLMFMALGRKTLDIKQLAEKRGVDIEIRQEGFIPHKKALSKLISADVALSLINSGRGWDAVYNGRTFEYLNAGIPILALTPKKSVVKDLLDETGAGIWVDSFDPSDVAASLEKIFYNPGLLPKRNIRAINHYSRREQARIMDKILRRAAR